MSLDYYLWKWKNPTHVSAGLCFLHLMKEQRHQDVAELDSAVSTELKIAVADELSTEESSFDYEVREFYVWVGAYGSTPVSVLECFQDLATRHNMVFYDPQNEKICASDRAQFDTHCAALESQARMERAAANRIRWQREFPQLQARAAEGDAVALTELGNRYSFGEGTQKNLESAFRCYAEGADKGNADAMFNVAACYRRGEGVAIDIAAAVLWYERAMATGDLFAPFALGEIFAKGEGFLRDKAKAVSYFRVALERGHPEARKALNELGI